MYPAHPPPVYRDHMFNEIPASVYQDHMSNEIPAPGYRDQMFNETPVYPAFPPNLHWGRGPTRFPRYHQPRYTSLEGYEENGPVPPFEPLPSDERLNAESSAPNATGISVRPVKAPSPDSDSEAQSAPTKGMDRLDLNQGSEEDDDDDDDDDDVPFVAPTRMKNKGIAIDDTRPVGPRTAKAAANRDIWLPGFKDRKVHARKVLSLEARQVNLFRSRKSALRKHIATLINQMFQNVDQTICDSILESTIKQGTMEGIFFKSPNNFKIYLDKNPSNLVIPYSLSQNDARWREIITHWAEQVVAQNADEEE
jgi:hypothetical protein